MHAAQKPKSKLKFVTLFKESNMSTLWRREEFLRSRSKEELAKKAKHIEVTKPVTKRQEARYNFRVDPFENHFWQANGWGRNQRGSADCIYFRIQTVDRQGQGVPRGELA